MSNHLFVVTGGSGSGKSSLIETLGSHDCPHMLEAERVITQDVER